MERWLNWPVIATVCANGDNRTRRLELYQMTWTRPEYVNNNFVIKGTRAREKRREMEISVGDALSKTRSRSLHRATNSASLKIFYKTVV